MKEIILGVDLGTSSVKLAAITDTAVLGVSYCRYDEPSGPSARAGTESWMGALKRAWQELSPKVKGYSVAAMGLAGQVNTYLLTGDDPADVKGVVRWDSPGGGEALREVRTAKDDAYFLRHISMPHPDMVSYPLPRIRWIQDSMREAYASATHLLQPKDYLYWRLTGSVLSDKFTWRGLSNLEHCRFDPQLLADFGIDPGLLPPLEEPTRTFDATLPHVEEELGIPAKVPVYLGSNDFFAGLLGIGIAGVGQGFDLTGSSEHVGGTIGEGEESTLRLGGPYLRGRVAYGVTANSGGVVNWCSKNLQASQATLFGLTAGVAADTAALPIFLPYLAGERAPLFDPEARGVLFGLSNDHTADDVAASALEGVAFTVYDIWERLRLEAESFYTAGPAAKNQLLNQLKADILGMPIRVVDRDEPTATGAALYAAIGKGWFSGYAQSSQAMTAIKEIVEPNERSTRVERERFAIFRRLYDKLKSTFEELHGVEHP